jgi:hypothetical protein
MAMNPRLLRPLATGFNPKSIAGLVGWYCAESLLDITLDTGVSLLKDKSGSGYDLSQGTGTRQPLRNSTQNGKSVMTFDGSDDFLSRASVPVSQQWTAYAVVRKTITTGVQLIVSQQATSGTLQAQYLRANALVAESLGFQATNSAVVDAGPNILQNTWHVLAGVQTATQLECFVDNTTNGATNCTQQAATAQVLQISGFGNSASNTWQGDIAEVLLWNVAHSSSQRTAVNRWLGRRWGVTI